MAFLIDSNILCRLSDRNDPQYEEARKAVRLLLDRGEELFLVPQVEREFWVVATRPREQNGLGLTVKEGKERLEEFRAILKFRVDQSAIHEKWREFVVTHDVRGKPAHDTGIVAAAVIHGFENILTFDKGDFVRYGHYVGIKTPKEVLDQVTS